MKKQLLLLVLMMLPMVASAYDFEVDGIYYSLISIEDKTVGVTYDNNAFLKSYNGDIVIPSKVEYNGTEFRVTSILDVAFGSYNGGVITSVQLPETIKLIDSQAFWACKYLTEINLPNSLEVINYGAFADCSSLKRIVIPNSVVEINDLQTNRGVFQGCTSLESAILSENIKKIPYRAFYNCINLLEIEIPKGVESIGGEAFCNCKKVIEIVIPENVNNIGYKAFESCEELKSIKCLSSIPPVMYESFTNSHYMFTNLVVPPGTKEIYKSDENWGRFLNIEEEVGEIYNLVYYVNEEVYKSYEIRHGTAIIPEPAPSKDGYTFSGWSEIPATMPAHDVTVTGSFTINSYKLTYMIDDKVYKETMYEYGAIITPELQPEGDYATFEWIDLPQTMPAHDVVVYASYTSGISEVLMKTQRNIRIYSPNGKKLDKQQKGLNIVVLDDGTVKKVVIK